jgi:hypothetical protein
MQQVAEVKPSGGNAIGERTFADLLSPLIEPGFRLALAIRLLWATDRRSEFHRDHYGVYCPIGTPWRVLESCMPFAQ